jgi:hypothetical protein
MYGCGCFDGREEWGRARALYPDHRGGWWRGEGAGGRRALRVAHGRDEDRRRHRRPRGQQHNRLLMIREEIDLCYKTVI